MCRVVKTVTSKHNFQANSQLALPNQRQGLSLITTGQTSSMSSETNTCLCLGPELSSG
jgi:hypothetical protein